MPKQYEILFLPDNVRVKANEGASVYDVARVCDVMPNAFCGGNGTCGKCMVDITSGGRTVTKKACRTYVDADMTVRIHDSGKASILTAGMGRQVDVAPAIRSFSVQVAKPVIGDERSEWELFCESAGLDGSAQPPLPLVSRLCALREAEKPFFVTLLGNRLISLDSEERSWLLAAFDIGTTTIVCYLLDEKTGEQKAVSSMLNPQTAFGADVIARSRSAMEHGGNDLQKAVVKALNQLLEQACRSIGVTTDSVALVTIVGNTCMHHLLLNLSPASLVHAPYNPAIRQAISVPAKELGVAIFENGWVQLLPNIAGFVGADTVGCLVATDFPSLDGTTLIIDIGTNGEMVLGSKQRRIACSTAAGPAFEGAMIQCGMRGATGAIDHVHLENDRIVYSVIGGGKPAGICGSGLVDLIACLLEAGVLSSSGRIEEDGAYSEQITQWDGKAAFLLASAEDSLNGEPILLTQKDVRELQLAKAAMAAGIRLMSEALGISVDSISRILIAGAFGNYLDAHSACSIGLLPPELESRIRGIGNAAGEGAKICALNAAEYESSKQLAAKTEFLELATRADFQDCFVEELAFPGKDDE